MRDWITGVTAVLGVLMVLGGATILVLRALATTPRTTVGDDDTTLSPAATTTSAPARFARAARQLPDADRLIAWGLGLLVLALIAAGAISFNFSGQAGD